MVKRFILFDLPNCIFGKNKHSSQEEDCKWVYGYMGWKVNIAGNANNNVQVVKYGACMERYGFKHFSIGKTSDRLLNSALNNDYQ